MEGFRSVINECGFQDMGYVGPKFTWCNRRSDEERIRLRLDRVLTTVDWMELYRTSRVFHIVGSTSDHCALLLIDQQASPNHGKRRFHFEAAWIRYEKCKEIIQEVWKNHSGMHSSSGLVEGLNDCASGLVRWNCSDLGHIPQKIQEKRKSLQAMIQADLDGSNGEEIDRIRKEINELLDVEEIKWHQRSRVQWYQKGDRNTQFFHHKASQRKKKNEIIGLWDKEGRWCEGMGDIANVAADYFRELFTTSSPTRDNEVVDLIPRKITEEMNEHLTKESHKEEVVQAIHSMHPTKAPGPDSMPTIFYQKYWDIIGDDVSKTILNILNSNAPMADLNKTNIALIPKIKNPTKMSDFQPINLCNVSYKIISKILANRLKPILSSIISENQSAFVPGKLITDNVLVAFEIMHYLKKRKGGKDSYMAVKHNMSKAYDRVEWGFLENIMKKMGFDDKWINLIMKCISTVSYAVLINGEAHGCITPTRGLRQGDPISPYLFLLCSEGFTGLIMEAARNNKLSGISICRGSPRITHLLFADDSILYCKASGLESRELVNIL